MRNLIVILFLSLLAFSCEKTETTTELSLHAIFSCGNEYDLGGESSEEWEQRIVNLLSADGIAVIDHELDFEAVVHEGGFCGNCQPTGDILRVEVPEEDKAALLALGFQE